MLASVEITGVLGRQSASSFNHPNPPVAVSARPTTSGGGGGGVSKNLWERAQRPKVGGGGGGSDTGFELLPPGKELYQSQTLDDYKPGTESLL